MGDEKPMGQVIQIDEARIRAHLGELVRATGEETLNAMLDAEADQLCGAGRYERSHARQDTRAGSYERTLQTSAGEVNLKVPKLRRRTFETAIIDRYHPGAPPPEKKYRAHLVVALRKPATSRPEDGKYGGHSSTLKRSSRRPGSGGRLRGRSYVVRAGDRRPFRALLVEDRGELGGIGTARHEFESRQTLFDFGLAEDPLHL